MEIEVKLIYEVGEEYEPLIESIIEKADNVDDREDALELIRESTKGQIQQAVGGNVAEDQIHVIHQQLSQ